MEPTNKPRTTPKDFFLYLGVMIMLYSSILSLLVLLFDLINNLFPDAFNPVYGLYYYYLDLKGRIRENAKLGKTLASIAILGVLATIIFGFVVMGTPGTQRALRLDQTRTYDLQNIQYQVVYYWQQHQALPKSL